ncbi:MAG: FecR domain-containing protein [Desulfamplus sp.]|nr:FecR domain-containing protein [Desulfamplus sp.]MBF0412411.1 FecR domain-containing protein [Desulfamplus sp.]
MEKLRLFILCLTITILLPCLAMSHESPIGKVKTAKGEVVVSRSGQEIPLSIGDKLYQNDIIKTGQNSSVGVIFEDNTVLSLGSQSQIAIDEYVFEPQKGKLSMIASMIKGTASYLSGIIGRQSPESVKIHTPDVTIGIRGTKFLIKVDGSK